MEERFRWPKKGDDPFPPNAFDPRSPTWVNLDWLAAWISDDSLHALAFKEAGDKIIKELSTGKDPRHPDMFFMPIMYLYRHSLELGMKQIIRLGIRLESVEDDEKVRFVLKNHNLNKLWRYVRTICKDYTSKDEIDAVSKVIHRIHAIDKSGQSLRYSKTSSGKKTIDGLPRFVRLEHLKEVVDGVFNFLQAGDACLTEALKMSNEVR